MSHEKIQLGDINITGTQVWKIHAKGLHIQVMNPLSNEPNYLLGAQTTKVNLETKLA